MNADTSIRGISGSVATRWLRATGWSMAYIFLAAFPLLMLVAGKTPKGGGFWWDFAMGLGFGGLAMMGLQSVLTARFRRATAPFGVDIIYYFHRLAAVGGFGLIAGHYLILRTRYGETLGSLNPLDAPWHMTAGRIALLLFAILIVSSLWRKSFHLEYDRWRIGHAAMAVAAIVLAILHIQGVGHYTRATGRGMLWVGYSALWAMVVGYVRVVRPWTLSRFPYRVVGKTRERGRCWTLTVEPEGHAGLQFNPGQFAWLTLGSSPFRAKEHPFSFSSSASKPKALSFTIKELGDFTRTIKDVAIGERAYVDGPHGIFTTDLHPSASRFVFIAGGVGIAPVMSMLRTLADRKDLRPIRLVYGSRAWGDVLFREEIDALRTRLLLEVVHVLQEPPAEWKGSRGILDETVLGEAIPSAECSAVFFLCGPKPMSDSVQRTLRRRGVPLHRIHCELFEMA
jgi:predicted ferric reductase